MGDAWTADYLKITGELDVDLKSNIAAEARAKIVNERLINFCDDPGSKDALQFLMTREITHMKAFTAALESLGKAPFSIGNIPPTPVLVDQYFNDSTGEGDEGETPAVHGTRGRLANVEVPELKEGVENLETAHSEGDFGRGKKQRASSPEPKTENQHSAMGRRQRPLKRFFYSDLGGAPASRLLHLLRQFLDCFHGHALDVHHFAAEPAADSYTEHSDN